MCEGCEILTTSGYNGDRATEKVGPPFANIYTLRDQHRSGDVACVPSGLSALRQKYSNQS